MLLIRGLGILMKAPVVFLLCGKSFLVVLVCPVLRYRYRSRKIYESLVMFRFLEVFVSLGMCKDLRVLFRMRKNSLVLMEFLRMGTLTL